MLCGGQYRQGQVSVFSVWSYLQLVVLNTTHTHTSTRAHSVTLPHTSNIPTCQHVTQESLVLSPSTPVAVDSNRTLLAKLQGDFSLRVMTSQLLLIPHFTTWNVRRDQWLVVDKTQSRWTARNHIGTSFPAYQSPSKLLSVSAPTFSSLSRDGTLTAECQNSGTVDADYTVGVVNRSVGIAPVQVVVLYDSRGVVADTSPVAFKTNAMAFVSTLWIRRLGRGKAVGAMARARARTASSCRSSFSPGSTASSLPASPSSRPSSPRCSGAAWRSQQQVTTTNIRRRDNDNDDDENNNHESVPHRDHRSESYRVYDNLAAKVYDSELYASTALAAAHFLHNNNMGSFYPPPALGMPIINLGVGATRQQQQLEQLTSLGAVATSPEKQLAQAAGTAKAVYLNLDLTSPSPSYSLAGHLTREVANAEDDRICNNIVYLPQERTRCCNSSRGSNVNGALM
eukprot:jgi/Chlat1/5033/Chrsp32S04994